MRVDFAKLRATGFHITIDEEGMGIYLTMESGQSKLLEMLRSHATTPIGQDLIGGTTLDAIAKAKFLETL